MTIMNLKKIIPIILAVLSITACDDNKMVWEEVDPSKQITEADIPLSMAEKISRYDALKTYTDMKLGVGIGLSLYMDDETYAGIVNENFDEVVVGYAMKHAPMVSSTGALNFQSVDAFVEKVKSNGLSVYGHTLVWHQNQDASYLNGLIAPEVIPAPAGSNLVANGDFEGNIDGWGSWGGALESVTYTSDEKVSGDGAVKAVTGAGAANLWDLEIQSSDVPVIAGHRYEITFFIKSEGVGHVRIAFNNMNNGYPWINGAEAVETSAAWQQVTFNAESIGSDLMPADGATTMNFRFDVGKDPNMTYYIDNVVMVDIDAEGEAVNYLANGNFDTDISTWAKWNGPDNCISQATGNETYEGAGALKVVHDISEPSNQWKVQIHVDFTETPAAGDYVISYYIRSDAAGSVRCSTTGTAFYQADQATSSTWKYVEWNITSDGAVAGLNFDLGAVAGTYYIDNVIVGPKDGGSSGTGGTGPTYIDKTDEEKAQIIGEAMESWISQMVGHFKNDIHSWDVVNEPMNENGTLRDGNVSATASDEFYWQKYLGKDYAVTAFKLARQNGNDNDILFINDYNLEYSLDKCKGLIDYVTYIESQGAQVDGIGTQMHVGIGTDTTKIVEMFNLLAASGKMIKVTEMDVRVNTNAPSADDFEKQAKMYQFIVKSFLSIIPQSQQYGITAWGVSDAPIEHENWIPDDGPNLWDANYQRKLAYKYFADGLAGFDVSKDFTGELLY